MYPSGCSPSDLLHHTLRQTSSESLSCKQATLSCPADGVSNQVNVGEAGHSAADSRNEDADEDALVNSEAGAMPGAEDQEAAEAAIAAADEAAVPLIPEEVPDTVMLQRMADRSAVSGPSEAIGKLCLAAGLMYDEEMADLR